MKNGLSTIEALDIVKQIFKQKYINELYCENINVRIDEYHDKVKNERLCSFTFYMQHWYMTTTAHSLDEAVTSLLEKECRVLNAKILNYEESIDTCNKNILYNEETLEFYTHLLDKAKNYDQIDEEITI